MKKLSFIFCCIFLAMTCGCKSTVDGLQRDITTVLKKMEIESLNPKEKESSKETISTYPAQPAEAENTKKVEAPKTVVRPSEMRYALTIEPNPQDSSIKLMNIDEEYYPGISLSPGYYEVMVEHKGYTAYREWIKVENNKTLKISLNKTGTATVSNVEASQPEAPPAPIKKEKPVAKEAQITETPIAPAALQLPATLSSHTESVTCLSFSPDGNMLASGSYDSTVIIWNLKDGSILHKLNQGDKVKTVEFSPQGAALAAGGQDKYVKLWDAKSGKQINTFKGLTDRVYSLEFSPRGDLLAVGGNNEVIMWNTGSGRIEQHLVGNVTPYPRLGPIKAIAFNPDGKDANGISCAFTCQQGIALFKPDNKEIIIIPDKSMPSSLTYSPNGKYIAWGARHQYNENSYYPRFLKVDTREMDQTITRNDDAASPDRIFYTAYTPGGRQLIMLSYNQAVLYDIKTGAIIRTFSGTSETAVTDAALSPDGKILAATAGNNIRLWPLD